MFRKFFVAVPIAVLAVGGSTACATKKFVRTSVGEVNDKVDSLGRSVEETQERTRQNEGQHHRGRSEGAGGRPGGRSRPRPGGGGGTAAAATQVGTKPTRKFEASRQGQPSGWCSKSS